MKKAKIIVLSGQSNAVGVGHWKCLERHISEGKLQEYLTGYDNIKINYYSHGKKSDGFVATTKNCTAINRDTFGPELAIAEYLNSQFPGEEYFIVKFAMGGASLQGDFLSPSSGGYYNVKEFKSEYPGFIDAFLNQKPLKAGWCFNGLVDLLHDSISSLDDKGYVPEIVGFCWMQGESDSLSPEDVNNYQGYFDNFIKDFKNQFAPYLKNCVFVDAGISEIWDFHQEINDFKKDYAQRNDNFLYVDTIEHGLTTRYEPVEAPDIYHYDSRSVIKLGKLFAEQIFG